MPPPIGFFDGDGQQPTTQTYTTHNVHHTKDDAQTATQSTQQKSPFATQPSIDRRHTIWIFLLDMVDGIDYIYLV